ncbi:DinB family protein [Streptomyces lushanensis]|uniref:DinB family protein n=1 Tax=Streptomyces lushanensis TaxID=1434255 RepID=UPI00082B5EAE|nr:DinB family protein [Streptomyces lushanensis]
MTTSERTERIRPSTVAGERESLQSWLDHHRETLALKCAGLTEAQLREASVPPSELTLLGLVRHMAEVERAWFRRTLSGEEAGPIYYSDADQDGDFHPGEGDTWDEAYATWQAEITRARELAAPHSLDHLGAGRRDRTTGEPYNLRWIYTHMIEEYARHNGHADLIRERIDGVTGE